MSQNYSTSYFVAQLKGILEETQGNPTKKRIKELKAELNRLQKAFEQWANNLPSEEGIEAHRKTDETWAQLRRLLGTSLF